MLDHIGRDSETLSERLVAENFAVKRGELCIGGKPVTELAREFGTPLYTYDADLLRRNYRNLAESVSGFAEVAFSIKANPLPEIASIFVSEGAILEVASIGEFRKALEAGCQPSRVLFAGPGKGQHELAEAIAEGIGEIHLESFEEAQHVDLIAKGLGRKVECAIRINPVATVQGGAMRMGGKPTAFGFDEEDLEETLTQLASLDGIELVGVHLFAGTQILKADVLLAQWRHGLNVASRVGRLLGKPIKTIDLGGGLGVPYHKGDKELDLDLVRAAIPELLDLKNNDEGIRHARVLLEPGRYLAASAGIYLMSVRAVKVSRGERFVIADGGMHHHLAASGNLGQVLKKDYPIVAAQHLHMDAETEQANLVGPLCTPLDMLGRSTALPQVVQGDLIAVLQSGAYGASASPINFLSHAAPAEVLIDAGCATRLR